MRRRQRRLLPRAAWHRSLLWTALGLLFVELFLAWQFGRGADMSGTLPNWLADWLGVERSGGGDAATWQLDLAWPWPPWATVLLGARRRRRGSACSIGTKSAPPGGGYRALLAALRLTAIALVLMMLTQATLTLQRTGPPAIALVIDRSASMGIADRYDEPGDQQAPLARLGSLWPSR